MRILILTTGHISHDDRLYYHFAETFSRAGHSVYICSTYDEYRWNSSGITVFSRRLNDGGMAAKMRFLYTQVTEINPDLVICAEAVPVIPAFAAKVMNNRDFPIYQDITEWYPETVTRSLPLIQRAVTYLLGYKTAGIAAVLADGFLYGESKKLARALLWAPGKPAVYIPYFRKPDYTIVPRKSDPGSLHLAFTGILSRGRGYLRFLDSVSMLITQMPRLKLTVTVIGRYEDDDVQKHSESFFAATADRVVWRYHSWLSFTDYHKSLADVDVCVDLRDDGFFYTESLPIKFFDYLSLGKAVIYTKNNAIQALTDMSRFGFFVRPDDIPAVVQIYRKYAEDGDLLLRHKQNALHAGREEFNRDKYEQNLLQLTGKQD